MATHWTDQINATEAERTAFFRAVGDKLAYPVLLSHGLFFQPQPLPKGIAKGEFRACFRNAYTVLKRHGKKLDLFYVEGFATSSLVNHSVLHAWCTDKHGNVIDTTWKAGTAYFGVAFRRDYVLREIGQRIEADGNDARCGFFDYWEEEYPFERRISSKPEIWKQFLEFSYGDGINLRPTQPLPATAESTLDLQAQISGASVADRPAEGNHRPE